MEYEIKFIKDSNIDDNLNIKLIRILSLCFPHQPIFQTQRYFKEIPSLRWFIENDEKVIAHVALHTKVITIDGDEYNIGGIAEVCVDPDYRRTGLVKKIFEKVHKWLIDNQYKYVMLFGEQKIYESSGYFNVLNEIKYYDIESMTYKIEKNIDAMAKLLTCESWPKGLIDLKGPTF